MSAITINGDLIHYEKLGRGRPVILVHGWLGSWRYWIPLMQQLHLKYSVYTLDLLGFGDSAKNPDRYGVEYQMSMLDQFMDNLGISKAAFIGHGLGSLVLTEFAVKNPQKIARMLLVSTPLFDPGDLGERVPAGQRVLLTPGRDRYSMAPDYTDETVPNANTSAGGSSFNELPTIGRIDPVDRQRLVERARQLQERDKAPEKAHNNNQDNPLRATFSGKSLVDLLDKCFKRSDPVYDKLKPDIDKADDKVLQRSAEAYDAGTMLDNLRRIAQPVLMVHGKEDLVLPPPDDNILQYLTLDRDDTLVPIVLSGVRHFPMLENDAFIRLAQDFLEVADISKLELRDRWRRRSR